MYALKNIYDGAMVHVYMYPYIHSSTASPAAMVKGTGSMDRNIAKITDTAARSPSSVQPARAWTHASRRC